MVPGGEYFLRDGKPLDFQGKVTWSFSSGTRDWDLAALEEWLGMRKCLSFKEISLGR